LSTEPQSRDVENLIGKAAAVIAVGLILAPGLWAGSKYKVLHAFKGGADGGGVYGGLVVDGKGNLYGVTSGGGAQGDGTAFELSPLGNGRWTKATLHSFCSLPHCADGALPSNTLTLDSVGNLFGTSNAATFQMTPGSVIPLGWSFQVIFNSGSGSSLILDQAGNLYGPMGAGKYGKGAATELSPGSKGWTETYLYSFCPKFGCLDGDEPTSPLTWDASGNLYGATEGGGKGNLGVVFQLEHTASGWKEHVLHNFPAFSTDGYDPDGGLTLDQKGNVYGTASQGGGLGNGTVFELTRGADGRWKETILYDYPDAFNNGGGADAGVVFDRAGNLYGTTPGGGDPNCQCGVVFKMTPNANGKWTYSVLHRFTGADGFDPEAGLIFDKDYKHLYGTTTEGGANGAGVVFEITP
jgi:uncharacterized repeat protein (TIGR03803 family)